MYDEETVEYIKSHYQHNSDRQIAAALGIPWWTVRDIRHRFNLFKDSTPKPVDEREVRRTQYLENEVRRLRQELSREREAAAALDRVEEAIFKTAPRIRPRQHLPKARQPSTKAAEVACFVISDIHFGQTFPPDEMGNINQYNIEVARKRLEEVTAKAIKIATERIKPRSAVVFVLGDLVSGMIHEELEATDEISVPEQAIAAADAIQLSLRQIAEAIGHTRAVCLSGNHGRLRRKKWARRRQYENWDFVACQFVAAFLSQHKNIEIVLPRSPWIVEEILGYRILATHGDHIRSSTSWGGLPFYGLSRDAFRRKVLYEEHDIRFDAVLMGHFHTFALIPLSGGLKVILAPSLVGPDPYSETLAAGSQPAALLFGVAESVGITSIWELKPTS